MKPPARATRIAIFDFHSPPMRAFHMAWMAFFLCFFAWFGLAPLMPVVRDELGLSPSQVGWSMIASVAMTMLARPVVGWLCDQFGPRRTYTALLVFGSLPVMGVGLSHSFATFLIFRLLIGIVGASFVITQYHTSIMFAPQCVGTANATTAGWGNLGGGVVQLAMPLLFGALVGGLGLSPYWGWRLSMVVAGGILLLAAAAYYFLTQDTPEGDFKKLRAAHPPAARKQGAFLAACRDTRTWLLFIAYAACFGLELTIKNVAALYFVDYFALGIKAAGAAAAAYGLMNLFARTLGGFVSDRCAGRWGLVGRGRWLFVALVGEGLALMVFSQARTLVPAVLSLMLVGLFVQMSNGATYAVVPFVNRRGMGTVAGIVGAGGNAGAVAAGFLFQGQIAWPTAILVLGVIVLAASVAPLLLRFGAQEQEHDDVAAFEPQAASDAAAHEALATS